MTFLNLWDQPEMEAYLAAPQPTAQLYVYTGQTDQLSQLFTDAELTETQANPVRADASGRFAPSYTMSGPHRVELRDPKGQPLQPAFVVTVKQPVSFTKSAAFDTVDAITSDQALTYTPEAGDIAVAAGDTLRAVQDNIGYQVQAPSAPAPHLQTAGGVKLNVHINRNDYDLKAEAFGVRFDGADADATWNGAQLRKAMDWLHQEGQGGRITLPNEGHLKLDQPIIFRDHLTIDGAGSLVENIRPADISPNYGAASCFVLGHTAKQDTDNWTFHTLGAIAKGENVITPPSTGGYRVGDVVLVVRADATLGTGSYIPEAFLVTAVAAVTGGQLVLKDPLPFEADAGGGTLGTDATGAWCANVSYRVNAANDTGLIDGRHFVHCPTLTNVRMKTAFGAPMRRCGMYGAHLENLHYDDTPYGPYFNGLAKSRVHGLRGTFYTRGIEIAVYSQDSTISDFDLQWRADVTDQSDPPELPMTFGENAQNVIIRDGQFRLGQMPINVLNPSAQRVVAVNRSEACALQNVRFSGNVAQTNHVVDISLDAVQFSMTDCHVDCGDVAEALVMLNGTEPRIRGTYFGCRSLTGLAADTTTNLVGGIFSGNHIAHEAALDIKPTSGPALQVAGNRGITHISPPSVPNRAAASGNTSQEWHELQKCSPDYGLGASTITINQTTRTIQGDVIVLRPETLRQGDLLSFRVSGDKSGSAGPLRMRFYLAEDVNANGVSLDGGDDVTNVIAYSVPATARDWRLDVRFQVLSSTQIAYSAELVDDVATAPYLNANRVTGVQMGTNEIRFELAAWVDAGDSATIRTIDRQARRFGMG